jgi:hypothetical protein
MKLAWDVPFESQVAMFEIQADSWPALTLSRPGDHRDPPFHRAAERQSSESV